MNMTPADQAALAEWNRIMDEAKKAHEAELARAEWERS